MIVHIIIIQTYVNVSEEHDHMARQVVAKVYHNKHKNEAPDSQENEEDRNKHQFHLHTMH